MSRHLSITKVRNRPGFKGTQGIPKMFFFQELAS